MKWSIQELNKYRDDSLPFEDILHLETSLQARNHEILSLSPVKVSGSIHVRSSEYLVYLKINGILTLPSSRSLVPVEFPLNNEIQEIYMTEEQFANRDVAIDEEDVLVLNTDTLDLQEAVEDHILLAIPLQVLTEEEKKSDEFPKGDFWEIVSEASFEKLKATQKKDEIDPRLAKLSELFNDDSEDA